MSRAYAGLLADMCTRSKTFRETERCVAATNDEILLCANWLTEIDALVSFSLLASKQSVFAGRSIAMTTRVAGNWSVWQLRFLFLHDALTS